MNDTARSFNWKKLLSLKLPQRAKVFLWLAIHQRCTSANTLWRTTIGPELIDEFLTMLFNMWMTRNLVSKGHAARASDIRDKLMAPLED
ncbi:hypothetical protein V6N11_045431 [Hibiscus sabdariffa]|uniref:Reverse transcriptase zinc-binding domain-containing protein n=1 Tax=Hibiscus sabdariffa TaxID=183260 RepID=A0ABR2Q1B3_9ROSI